MRGLSLGVASGGHSLVVVPGFSLLWLPLLRSTDSRGQAQWPLGMWNLPAAGVEPASPALAGGFLTTGPIFCFKQCESPVP